MTEEKMDEIERQIPFLGSLVKLVMATHTGEEISEEETKQFQEEFEAWSMENVL